MSFSMFASRPDQDVSASMFARSPSKAHPGFVEPPSLENTVLVIGVVLTVLSTIVLVLRLVANYKNMGRLALDDYLCIFGEIGGITYWALTYSSARIGMARHTWDVPVTAVTSSFLKKQFAIRTVVPAAMWAVKATILALYVRIFGTIRWLRLTSYVLIVSMFLFYGSMIIAAAVYCAPRAGAPWDATSNRRCSKPVEINFVIGTVTVSLDLVLFLLPFPAIYKLQLSRNRKIGLSIVFALGLLTVITSIVNLAYRVIVVKGAKRDPVWNGMNVTITAFFEIFGTIILGCAPALALFWTSILTRTAFYQRFRSAFSRTSISWTGISGSTLRPSGDENHPEDRNDPYDSTTNLKHDQEIELRQSISSHALVERQPVSPRTVISIPSNVRKWNK